MHRYHAVRALGLAMLSILFVFGVACGGDTDPECNPEFEDCSLQFQQVTVTVDHDHNGSGSGTVVAEDINTVGINCVLPPNASHPAPNPTHDRTCTFTFPDAGGGGSFRLDAEADAGSVFTSWVGCSQTSGPVCILDFSAGADVVFLVTAKFDLAGASNTVLFYNSATVPAYLVGPGETPGPANLVASHGPARNVTIPTTVGSQSTFRAYLTLGSPAATITCMVTADAWQNGTQPLVFFDNSEGNFLTCSDGLVAP